ncbi:MAG: EamA family transporter RarD [Microbacteriaceae bacterium]
MLSALAEELRFLKKYSERSQGTFYIFAAYLFWGGYALYFSLLQPMGPLEIIVWRMVSSLGFCLLLLALIRQLQGLFYPFRSLRNLLLFAFGALLSFSNWVTFLIAIELHLIVETSMGGFMSPLLISLMGVIFFKERMRPLQWVSLLVCAGAVTYLILGYGTIPFLALFQAITWALYTLVRKLIGDSVGALQTMTLEAILLIPFGVVVAIWLMFNGGFSLGTISVSNTILVLACGLMATIPLLFFAASASRIPLVTMGFAQYLAPILSFLTGVYILAEEMPGSRWVSFFVLWGAVLLLVLDSILEAKEIRKANPMPAPVTVQAEGPKGIAEEPPGQQRTELETATDLG